MTECNIIKSTQEDLESTIEMFIKVTDHMLSQGIDQWNYDYPDKVTIGLDIQNGEQYLIKDKNRVVASMVLNDEQDEQYGSVHWKRANKKVMVIHRLGVHPEYQGKGLGKKMCLFAEEFGLANGFESIRLDAYAGNTASNALYNKLGYKRANGYCYFRKKAIPFYCYEKGLI